MDDNDDDIMVFVATYTLLRLKQRRKRRRRIMMALRRQVEQRVVNRGLYCQLGCLNRDIAAIMRYDPEKCKQHIRVSPYALYLFCGKLKKKQQGWATEFEAILFLFWLACGVCFRIVAVSFNVPRSTAHRVTRRILKETLTLVQQVIVLPVGEEVEEVGQGFERLCGSPVFRRAVGSIDGCHIRTLTPSHLHEQYINQKLFYSILLQGLVDHRGMFIDIFAGLPGSVHDMRALRLSTFFRRGLYPPHDYFILGDKGYACIMHPITLIPPYKEPLNPDKRDFNFHLSRGRCIVERVFGLMKNRWRSIYTKALEVSLETGVQVLGACAVLHNICISAGEALGADVENHHPERRPERDEANAAGFRDLLLNLHTAHRNQNNDQHA